MRATSDPEAEVGEGRLSVSICKLRTRTSSMPPWVVTVLAERWAIPKVRKCNLDCRNRLRSVDLDLRRP